MSRPDSLDAHPVVPMEATRGAPELDGLVALVTGGSGEIGSAVVDRLASAGASVAVGYLRARDRAETVAENARGRGVQAEVAQGNVAEAEEADRLVEGVAESFGGLDVLVHCASLGTFTPVLQTRSRHWDLTFATHVKGFLHVARAAAPHLAPGSSLVAVSSLGARRFTPRYGAVGPAKAALESLVRYLAVELSPRRIRVNAVSGGPVDGERLRASPDFLDLQDEARERPPGRMGTPAELADAAVLLTSPMARWVNGQTIVADGGFSLW